jgi:hypothetical protein
MPQRSSADVHTSVVCGKSNGRCCASIYMASHFVWMSALAAGDSTFVLFLPILYILCRCICCTIVSRIRIILKVILNVTIYLIVTISTLAMRQGITWKVVAVLAATEVHLERMTQRTQAVLEEVVPLDLECSIDLEASNQRHSCPRA